jgi:radical SAM superfamily enzyme YgiQ (UPF0313 family)
MASPQQSPGSSRVLLVNLNHYDQPYPVYPVGLAYVDGALRAAGYATQIWDASTAANPIEETVHRWRPDFIGLSLRNIDNVQCHNPRSFVRELTDCCARLRAVTSVPLILGGSAYSVFPRELFLLAGADYGVCGEGERVIVELLDALRAGRLPGELPGLVRRDFLGGVQEVPRRPCKSFHDSVPAHDPGILAAYIARGSLPGVQTQRGCPLQCCYCTYPLIEGTRSRFRTGEEVASEIGRLAALGVRYVFMVDSVFNTRTEHVVDVCEALIRARIDVGWECFLRPRGVTRELLTLMRRAGLRHVEFGSDSLSDPVLQSYGKSFSYADIEQASLEAVGLGLNCSHFIIFGGPGETPETVEETLARTRRLSGAFFFATIGMRIYPGTPLWRQLAPEKRGETPADYLCEPRFYLEAPFTVEGLYSRLQEERRTAHNWAVGDPPPVFAETMEKLRQRGVHGPMWEYIELLQRLSQNGVPPF